MTYLPERAHSGCSSLGGQYLVYIDLGRNPRFKKHRSSGFPEKTELDTEMWLLPLCCRSLTILPALLMEECQALSQGQSHPQGTSPVTGVLSQVVAQGTLEKSRGRAGHMDREDHPRVRPPHTPACTSPADRDALAEPGQDTTDNQGLRKCISQSDRKK